MNKIKKIENDIDNITRCIDLVYKHIKAIEKDASIKRQKDKEELKSVLVYNYYNISSNYNFGGQLLPDEPFG